MMYDNIIKRLQDFAASTIRDEDAQLAFDAANAIEELSLTADSYKRSAEEWADEAYRAYSKYAKSIFDSPKEG